MSRRIRKYENTRKMQTRSTSESVVNALFARNLFARNLRQTDTKKKKLEISQLPPVDANHELLQDSDSLSFHVRLDDTFDKLKNPFDKLKNDPFDMLTSEKTNITKENTLEESNITNEDKSAMLSKNGVNSTAEDYISYSHMFEGSNLGLVGQKRGSGNQNSSEANLELTQPPVHASNLDLSVSNYSKLQECQGTGNQMVSSTPITKKLRKPEDVNDGSSVILEKSIQQIYNWSYIAPDISAYDTVIMKRMRRNRRCKGINGYKPETKSLKTPEKSTSSFVAMKFASNQSLDSQEVSQSYFEPLPSGNEVSLIEEANISKNIKKTDITVDAFENFTTSLPLCQSNTDYCGEDDEFDYNYVHFDNLEDNQDLDDKLKETQELGITYNQFEEFYSSVKDVVVISGSEVDFDGVCDSVREKSIGENASSWVNKKRGRVTKNIPAEENSITLNPFVPRRVLRRSTILQRVKSVNEQDISTLLTSDRSSTPVASLKVFVVDSPDIFASSEDEDKEEGDELSNIEIHVSTDCEIVSDEDKPIEAECSPVQVKVSENSGDIHEYDLSDQDEITEMPKICMRKARESFAKPIVIQPGKSWRRSLASYRKTLVAHVLEGAKCTCQECAETKVNRSIARRTRFTLSTQPNTTQRRTTKYERDRLRETAKLETLIENISLDVSQLKVTPSYRAASEIVLERCRQKRPVKFSKCYNDALLRNCQKIGEGVYGEVFLCRKAAATTPAGGGGTTVMKVIPIEGEMLVNGERQKQFEEILSEIVIASELSNLRTSSKLNRTGGFNELQRVRCVQGAYPARLIDLWELYEETKGTENDNPSAFDPDQQYIVLELANAGADLESFIFTNYVEVYQVFLQIVLSLAVAEAELQFEHRDLHWGNVLIQRVPSNKQCDYLLNGQAIVVPSMSVEASIIDFTLSRITYENINFYNDLSQDPDLFNAEGDYQFEIYKLMQIANCNEWEPFQPKSNVFWLHYLLDKMTTSLRMLKQTGKAPKRTLLVWAESILNYKSALEFVEKVVLPHLGQGGNYI